MSKKFIYEVPVIVRVHGENDEDEIDSSLSTNLKVLNITCTAFNQDDIKQYLPVELEQLRMYHTDGILFIDAIISDFEYLNLELRLRPIVFVKDYICDLLNGQMSDGWGEGFEQFSYTIGKDNYTQEVYISCWDRDKHCEFVRMEEC